MKFVIVFAAILAVATALPASTGTTDQETTILKQHNDNIGVGHYNTE